MSTVAGSWLVWGWFIVSVMVLVAFLTMFANVCVDSREALTAACVLALLMICEYVGCGVFCVVVLLFMWCFLMGHLAASVRWLCGFPSLLQFAQQGELWLVHSLNVWSCDPHSEQSLWVMVQSLVVWCSYA